VITIGLAGHIDHGKSSLVRRLTGVDPDRLPEEKARGMTIDLGFAHWSPEDEPTGGVDVSFVDVPGHERFVRNMIAGAGGIEAVMLVVAADDGWMPQSQEHFDIIRLLDIRKGIIVVNKIDLAEPDWLKEVIDDVRQRIAGSFLQDVPIIPVSSTTGEGFPELERCLKELSREFEGQQGSAENSHHDIGKPRLTIDRSFMLPGIGGIVTGSARGGAFAVGDEVVIAPTKASGKIRALHRHEQQVEKVSAGQRAALSFTGIDREMLLRGAFVTTPQLGDPSLNGRVLLVKIEALPDCPVKLTHRRKLLLFFGAAEIPCEIRLAGGQELRAGEQTYAALRCDVTPFCFAGDRFVLRLPTPQITIGGGVVLDWSAKLPEKDELKRRLQVAETQFVNSVASPDSELASLLKLQLRIKFPQEKDSVLLRSVFSQKQISEAVEAQIRDGEIIEGHSLLFPAADLNELLSVFISSIKERFVEAPHLKGLSQQEVLRLIPNSFSNAITDDTAVLTMAVSRGLLATAKGLYQLPGQKLTVSGAVRKESERILSDLQANPFAPPLIAKLITNGKVSKEALGFLLNTDQVVKINSDLVLSAESWREALDRIRRRLDSGGELNVAWLRSDLDTSRKYALPLLEALDRLEVTERIGDNRIPGQKFAAYFQELASAP
jgi:selenocysteine-specific elongation factor